MIHFLDFELSRKLFVAGFPQDDINFQWLQLTNCPSCGKNHEPELDDGYKKGDALELAKEGKAVIYAAPSAGELGLLLMSNIDEFIRNTLPQLNSELFYEWCTTDHPYYNPNLLAKVWLYLREIGLL